MPKIPAVAKGPKKPRKKILESMEVKLAMDGGLIVKHRFESDGPNYYDPEIFVFTTNE